ncbi:MAG: carotenoid biosynthesis protein [Polyangiales bacterium]
MIRAYGFYAYAPGWHLRVDHVPLLIPAIWAPVVLSSRAVARAMLPRETSPWREALLVGALVTFDAALIEPIAVRAGLWRWFYPGVLSVPVIGIVGWGCFAFAATWLQRALPREREWLTVFLAPLASHAMVLALWWGALRWALRDPVPFTSAAVALGVMSAAYTLAIARTGARLPWRELLPRAAATLFFAAPSRAGPTRRWWRGRRCSRRRGCCSARGRSAPGIDALCTRTGSPGQAWRSSPRRARASHWRSRRVPRPHP